MLHAAKPKSPRTPAPVLDGPDPHLHAGKCAICKHPQRAEIERAFVDWSSPSEITRMFGLSSRSTIYRHARARGLFELRRWNLHFGLARIAEHAADVKPSAASVIAAFIAMAKINARGEWDPGHRFDPDRAVDHAFWEEDWSAAREISLQDTIAGKPAPIHVRQENLRQFCAEYDARSAAEKLAAAKPARRQAQRERQANEKKTALPPQPNAERSEARTPEPPPQQQSQPVPAPAISPAAPAQPTMPPEPRRECSYPISQPPASAFPLENPGPYLGLLQPRKTIGFVRRGRRPVVG